MADWIKVRTNLPNDPRVVAISVRTKQSVTTIVGALAMLWFTADEHTVDGVLPGFSVDALDSLVSVPGFADALVAVGWIKSTKKGLQIQRFSKHNGQSAKDRALNSIRAQASRSKRDKSATEPHESVTGTAPREEKEKEKERGDNPPEINRGVGVPTKFPAMTKSLGPTPPTPPVASVPDNPSLPRLRLQNERLCRTLLESLEWPKEERGKVVRDKLHRKHIARLLSLPGCIPMRCHMLVERIKRGEGKDNPATWIEAGIQQAFELTGEDEAEYQRWFDRNYGAIDRLRAQQAAKAS